MVTTTDIKGLLLKCDGGLHSLSLRSCGGAQEYGEAIKELDCENVKTVMCFLFQLQAGYERLDAKAIVGSYRFVTDS